MTLQLDPIANAIVEKVRELTGKNISFVEKNDLPTYAVIKMARRKMESHILLYKTEKYELLNHLIAHECGHVLRMFVVPEDKRLIPATTNRLKSNALSRMGEEVRKLSSIVPSSALDQLVTMLYEGIVRQVTNQPPDLMIEKWLHQDYPALRPYQIQSIQKQRDEALAGLSDRIEKVTPQTIFDASHAMNYAFFRMLGELFGTNYVGRYRQTPYHAKGEQLVKLTKDCTDYEGDIENINRWAKFLNVDTWFEWTGFENVPENYAKMV